MSFDPAWEQRSVPPLNLRNLLLTSSLSATYPDAGLGTATAMRFLGACMVSHSGRITTTLRDGRREDGGTFSTERREKVARDMGSLLWYWLRLCYETGLDPYQLVAREFAEVSRTAAEESRVSSAARHLRAVGRGLGGGGVVGALFPPEGNDLPSTPDLSPQERLAAEKAWLRQDHPRVGVDYAFPEKLVIVDAEEEAGDE